MQFRFTADGVRLPETVNQVRFLIGGWGLGLAEELLPYRVLAEQLDGDRTPWLRLL